MSAPEFLERTGYRSPGYSPAVNGWVGCCATVIQEGRF